MTEIAHFIQHHTTWLDRVTFLILASKVVMEAIQRDWPMLVASLFIVALYGLLTLVLANLRCAEPYIRLGEETAASLRDNGIPFEGCEAHG